MDRPRSGHEERPSRDRDPADDAYFSMARVRGITKQDSVPPAQKPAKPARFSPAGGVPGPGAGHSGQRTVKQR